MLQKTTILLTALAGASLLALAAPSAEAANWSRQTSVTRSGPHSVTATRTYTGPAGNTVTRSGTFSHTGPGDFSSSRTVTGPNGRSITHTGQTDCGPFACRHTGTTTGPNGGSVSGAGWWWR